MKKICIEVRNLNIISHNVNGNISYVLRTLGVPRSSVRSVIKNKRRRPEISRNLCSRRGILTNFQGSLKVEDTHTSAS